MRRALLLCVSLVIAGVDAGDSLHEGFLRPPASARPHVWWHWMNGNVTKAGITADLEAMSTAGIGGAQIFDVSDGIPEGPVTFRSDAWYDMILFANEEAKRLGVELALSNCSGWSSSGGPWVTPADSMKHIVYTESVVPAGTRKPCLPPPPEKTFGYFRDLAVLAFPRPTAEAVDPADYGMKTTHRPGDPEAMITFERPFPLSGVSLDVAVSARHTQMNVDVGVSSDGVTFRPIVTDETVYTARYGDRNTAIYLPVIADSVRALRVRCDMTVGTRMPGSVWNGVCDRRPAQSKGLLVPQQKLLDVRPEARAGIPEFSEKIFEFRARLRGRPYAVRAAQAVDPAGIVDLTNLCGADGTLDWTASAEADWVVVRFGYASNGVGPRSATSAGDGLEVDKLSKPALARFFAGYVDKVLARLGPVSPKGGFNNVLVDSFEVGCQNWTDGLERHFRERKGYDLLPWLPLFTGRVVESVAETERVLADFRRVVSDLFVENYAAEFRRLCRARGLLVSLEGYGNAPCDDLRYARRCDIPMGEFWAGNASSRSAIDRLGGTGNSRFPGFISHVWGQRFAAAESFTSAEGERWNRDPYAYKAQGDRVYCQGVNRIIYHRWAHQPWTNPANAPGMTMGPHGSHFERTQTWWKDAAPAWLAYQARCQWLLQEGVAASDILVCAGDNAPNNGLDLSRWHDYALVGEDAFGLGRQWDVCGGEAIVVARAEEGGLVAPGGARYKAVVRLPDRVWDPETEAAFAKLSAAGVPVVPADQVDATLAARGIGPDVRCEDPALAKDFRWIHRRMADGSEVYFTALPNPTSVTFRVSFRIAGRMPEIWDPETATCHVPRQWNPQGDRLVVTLDFAPSGAEFVVFRPTPTAGLASAPNALPSRSTAVTGGWTVSFLDGRGAPEGPVAFDTLTPWNERAEGGIRHYSGSATYRKTLADPRVDRTERLVLDLGDVKNCAVVTVNGKTYPVLWKPPFRLDVSDAPIRTGRELSVEVRVTNLWPNRLIGDDALPCDAAYTGGGPRFRNGIAEIPPRVWAEQPSPCGRHTFTTWRLWKRDEPLLPSGLLGPVHLLSGE